MNAVIRGNAWVDLHDESYGLEVIIGTTNYKHDDLGFRIARHKVDPRALRGGAFWCIQWAASCSDRLKDRESARWAIDLGFRVSRRKP